MCECQNSGLGTKGGSGRISEDDMRELEDRKTGGLGLAEMFRWNEP